MKRIIIAIDGPAASGKSTTARAVAERLGYCHLNSGQLYRAVTWAALRGGWIDDEELFRTELERLELSLRRTPPAFSVSIGGEDSGEGLTAPETAARVAAVSARRDVREKVLSILRAAGEYGGVVCDGRDIGTIVFPSAALKVFLVASPVERGRRRLLDYGLEPYPARVREEAGRLAARDTADSSRTLAPLQRAEDAVEIDTTDMAPGEVVEQIVSLARRASEAGERSRRGRTEGAQP
jgi:cytidylate kinase